MEAIIQNILKKENIRTNLSNLRQFIREQSKMGLADDTIEIVWQSIRENQDFFYELLHHEDAKTRKNTALLLGDIAYDEAAEVLYRVYQEETTLFVKSSYLEAIADLELAMNSPILSDLKTKLNELQAMELSVENKKHIEEEIRSLRKILIKNEGISRHTADIKEKKVRVILLTNRTQRETVRRTITCGTAEVHPLGVLVETEHLDKLIDNRLYRDMVFPLNINGFMPAEPVTCGKLLAESDLVELLQALHKEDTGFYFRIELKNNMSLEERSNFTRKLASELESQTKGALINSTSDYEVELRLIANKEGMLFPCVKLATVKSKRFAYRKEAIAASVHPSTAALIMEIAAPYLKENAQILDPFCGVGTMLIERDNRVSAREMYGIDIFGDAILFARTNTALAKKNINYIHRDFMDFKHEYVFDEIVSNMPLRGKKTKQEMDDFYRDFFEKAKEILAPEAKLVLYTNELGFVKKQLRLQKEYSLIQETCLQPKNDFYLLILGYKG